MTTIITRAGKGSTLTWNEVDTNFTNLNANKIETTDIGVTVQEYSVNLDTYAGTAPTIAGLALLDDIDAASQRNTLGLGNVDNTSDTTKNSASVTLTNKTITASTNNVEALSGPNNSPLSSRNVIINGNFSVNQRAYVSGAAVGADLFGHDRWKMAASGDTYTFSTTANKTTITIPAGKILKQIVEGVNLITDTYTLSWEGTAQGKIGSGSYGNSGITSVITGGTNTTIEFGSGTVANVQLERGAKSTPFEVRPIGIEEHLCRRYYENSYSSGIAVGSASFLGCPGTVSVASGVSAAQISVRFVTPKRIIPTFHSYSPVNGVIDQITDSLTTNRNASFSNIGTTGAVIANAVTTTAAATHNAHWVADAEIP